VNIQYGDMDTHLGLLLPSLRNESVDFALRAESLGYDSLWVPELWGSSSIVQLAELAVRTDTIELGTAILNVFSRSPAVLAMTAATIDELSDGRFTLGVGTSTPKAIEDLHGMDFENPVRRAHETIELTKAFLESEGRVSYDGEMFHAADFPSLGADVAIYHAALGEANRRVVGRLCDGWIPHNIPFPELADAFEYVAEHAEENGRNPEDITVAPYVPAAVADDSEDAREAIRGHIAYYAGSGRGYQRAISVRFPEEVERIAEEWRNGERSTATAHVTDEMVTALGVAGTPDEARQQLRDLVSMDAIDHPLLTIPNNATQLADQTIEALAPAL
jgi:5,10-methylenetetrahydromethanopterin reductase